MRLRQLLLNLVKLTFGLQLDFTHLLYLQLIFFVGCKLCLLDSTVVVYNLLLMLCRNGYQLLLQFTLA